MKKILPFCCLLLLFSFTSCELDYEADNVKNKAKLLGKWKVTRIASPSENITDTDETNEFFDNDQVEIYWVGFTYTDPYELNGSRLSFANNNYEILTLTSSEMILLHGERVRYLEKIE